MNEGMRAQDNLEQRERELGDPANRTKGSLLEQEARRSKKKKQQINWFIKNQPKVRELYYYSVCSTYSGVYPG